jgi:hypothetical protein
MTFENESPIAPLRRPLTIRRMTGACARAWRESLAVIALRLPKGFPAREAWQHHWHVQMGARRDQPLEINVLGMSSICAQ